MNVRQKLYKSLNNVTKEYGVDRNDMNISTNLKNLGLDSLDQVQMIMDLENTFNIHIDDNFAEEMLLKIETVEDVLTILHDKYGIIDIKEERKNKIVKINEESHLSR